MKCGNQESKAFAGEAGPPELALVGEVVGNYKVHIDDHFIWDSYNHICNNLKLNFQPLNLGFGPWSIREYIWWCPGLQPSIPFIFYFNFILLVFQNLLTVFFLLILYQRMIQRSLKSIVQRSRDTNPICIHHKWLQFSTVFLQKGEVIKFLFLYSYTISGYSFLDVECNLYNKV